jgi:hypothetical protein
MMSQQWFFDWDNACVHTTAMVSSWFDAHGVKRLVHAPYSPNLAPADFVLLKIKNGAGRLEPGPGQLQERLGGGHEITDRRRLRCRLQKLGGALQKVRPPWRQVHRKIFRNKHPPSSNPFQFIDGFAFVCIHTSYIGTVRYHCGGWSEEVNSCILNSYMVYL